MSICSKSPPGGYLVDGLPPAQHRSHTTQELPEYDSNILFTPSITWNEEIQLEKCVQHFFAWWHFGSKIWRFLRWSEMTPEMIYVGPIDIRSVLELCKSSKSQLKCFIFFWLSDFCKVKIPWIPWNSMDFHGNPRIERTTSTCRRAAFVGSNLVVWSIR